MAVPVVLILAVTLLGRSSEVKFRQVGSCIDPCGATADPSSGSGAGGPTIADPVGTTEPPPTQSPDGPELGALTQVRLLPAPHPLTVALPADWTWSLPPHDQGLHVQASSAGDAEVTAMVSDLQLLPYATSSTGQSSVYASWLPGTVGVRAFAARFFEVQPVTGAATRVTYLQPHGLLVAVVDETNAAETFALVQEADGILVLRFRFTSTASVERVVQALAAG